MYSFTPTTGYTPTPTLPRSAGEGALNSLSRGVGEGWGGGAATSRNRSTGASSSASSAPHSICSLSAARSSIRARYSAASARA
jgi:hypothetical protein